MDRKSIATEMMSRVPEESPDALIRVSSSGTIQYANSASKPMLGYWNRRLGETVPGDWLTHISVTLGSNESLEVEADCEGKVFSFHIVPIPSDNYVIFYGRDITERKQMEKELRSSEQRFSLVMRGTNDGIWDLDLATGKIHFSSRWKEMLGYTEDEVEHSFKAWQDMIHPEDLGGVLDVWTSCMEGVMESFSTEYRMKTKAGDWIWVLCRGLALQNDSHTPTRLAGSHSDITDRKRAEEALFREKERAQVTLHSIGDAVITTDTKGCIDYMNPMAEKLTGWSLAEAMGLLAREVLNLLKESTGEPEEDLVQKCLIDDGSVDLQGHAILIGRDGIEFAIKNSVTSIRDHDNRIVGVVVVFDNVSEERQLKDQLTWQASHDGLTGLCNRHEFEQRLEAVIEKAAHEDVPHALLYLDLDQFKVVNDTCGHLAGDILLKHLAAILEDNVRDSDTVARLGGDEFGILLNRCPLEKARKIGGVLRQAIKDFQLAWEGRTFQVGVSIGLVPIHGVCGTKADLLKAADMACYKAKDLGRNRLCVYEEGDSDMERRYEEMECVTRITDALKSGRFRLYHQTIAPYSSEAAEGEHYEILLRMLDEEGNVVLPTEFLPAAERYSLMPTIDRWVIKEAISVLGTRKNALDNLSTCSINLSGDSLSDDGLAKFIREQLRIYDVPPEVICFEITETTAIANLSQAVQLINELKALGCRFALDDFGSGLSSFGYLKTLPVDYLKIDGAFVKDMVNDPLDRAMVKSINEVGHAMGKKTIAEWAEDEATLDCLKEIGVDYAQGYAIDMPKPFMPAVPQSDVPEEIDSELEMDAELPELVVLNAG